MAGKQPCPVLQQVLPWYNDLIEVCGDSIAVVRLLSVCFYAYKIIFKKFMSRAARYLGWRRGTAHFYDHKILRKMQDQATT